MTKSGETGCLGVGIRITKLGKTSYSYRNFVGKSLWKCRLDG